VEAAKAAFGLETDEYRPIRLHSWLYGQSTTLTVRKMKA